MAGKNRIRTCALSGTSGPATDMIRFVAGPDGDLVPDLAAKLPGRGIWVTADAELFRAPVALAKLAGKSSHQLGHKVRLGEAADDLIARIEGLMEKNLLARLGLMRAAGKLTSGYEKVAKALRGGDVCAMIEACDAGEDGRKKMFGLAAANKKPIPVIRMFDRDALSEAAGLANFVHGVLTDMNLAKGFLDEALRLAKFRGKAIDTIGGAQTDKGL